jgi:hypothetical protein
LLGPERALVTKPRLSSSPLELGHA